MTLLLLLLYKNTIHCSKIHYVFICIQVAFTHRIKCNSDEYTCKNDMQAANSATF